MESFKALNQGMEKYVRAGALNGRCEEQMES